MYVVLLMRWDDPGARDDTAWDAYGPFVDEEDAERWRAWARDDSDSGVLTSDVQPLRAPARREVTS